MWLQIGKLLQSSKITVEASLFSCISLFFTSESARSWHITYSTQVWVTYLMKLSRVITYLKMWITYLKMIQYFLWRVLCHADLSLAISIPNSHDQLSQCFSYYFRLSFRRIILQLGFSISHFNKRTVLGRPRWVHGHTSFDPAKFIIWYLWQWSTQNSGIKISPPILYTIILVKPSRLLGCLMEVVATYVPESRLYLGYGLTENVLACYWTSLSYVDLMHFLQNLDGVLFQRSVLFHSIDNYGTQICQMFVTTRCMAPLDNVKNLWMLMFTHVLWWGSESNLCTWVRSRHELSWRHP